MVHQHSLHLLARWDDRNLQTKLGMARRHTTSTPGRLFAATWIGRRPSMRACEPASIHPDILHPSLHAPGALQIHDDGGLLTNSDHDRDGEQSSSSNDGSDNEANRVGNLRRNAAADSRTAGGGYGSCGGGSAGGHGTPGSSSRSSAGAAHAAPIAAAAWLRADMSGMLLGRSSSSRSMSAAQTWLLRSETGSGGKELPEAAAADGGGSQPPPAASQRRPSAACYGGGGPAGVGCGDSGAATGGHDSAPALSRGRSFSNGSRGVSSLNGDAASGALVASALSFTAGAAASSTALKPTPPAPLRGAASFTLGSSGGSSRNGNRAGAAAASWARACTAVAAAAAGGGASPQAPSLLLSPRSPALQPQQPPSSMQQLLQHQRSMPRGRASVDLPMAATATGTCTTAATTAGVVEQPQQPQTAQPQPPQAQSKPAPLTAGALSLRLSKLASSVGIDYMGLGRRASEMQEAAAAEVADEMQQRNGGDDTDSADEAEAGDQLRMLRGTAAGEHVDRSWKSFTMGLRRHTTADGSCSVGVDAAAAATVAASEKSFTAGSGGFAQFRSSSMRIRFVPEDDDEEEEEEQEAVPQKPRDRYGAYPGRGSAASGRRSSMTTNLVLPRSFECASAPAVSFEVP